MRTYFRLGLFFISIYSNVSWGESHALSIQSLVAPNFVGIVGGRPQTDSEEVNRLMQKTVMIKYPGSEDLCSGVMVEGCIITAAHCIKKNEEDQFLEHRFFTGFRPAGDPAYRGSEIEVLGGAASPRDLAVIKVRGGLPRDAGFARAVFATEAPARNSQSTIIGYGVNGVQETIEGNQVSYRNVGAGVRRAGFTNLAGVQPVRNGRDMPVGNMLVTMRGQNGGSLAAHGDSGGPLFVGGTLHGIFSAAGNAATLRTQGSLADNDVHGFYAPVSENRARITDAMDRLGCAANVRAE